MAGLKDCLTAPPLEREAEPFHVGEVSTIAGKVCVGIPAPALPISGDYRQIIYL